LAGLSEKLAEIIGRNRLQNSDQRWAIAWNLILHGRLRVD
jgi:hypothetical protein